MTRTASSVVENAPAALSGDDLLRSALEFHAAGNFARARELYLRVIDAEPENAGAWHHLGLIAHVHADHTTAAEHVQKAIALKPDYAQAHSNLAAIFRATGDFAAAAASAETAIAIDPRFAAAYSNLGNVREDQGDAEAALAAYSEACRLDPHFIEAHTNAADLLRKLKRYEEGLAVCDAIVDKRPEAARPYFCAGNILRELLRTGEAIDAFRQAIALQPRFAEAWCNLGNLLLRQGAFEDAIDAYREAIAINPSIAQTYCNIGAAYELAQRPVEAREAYAKAVSLDPSLIGVEVQLFHQRRAACDWDGIEEVEASLLARVAGCKDKLPPFAFLSMESSPQTQLQVARLWCSALHAQRCFSHTPPAEKTLTRKLRIGYLSGDFHRHATAHLMAELFERHDRTRFEIIAYSHGMDDCSEMRYRLGQAFDAFIDLRNLDDRQAAQRIHADGIDILVELKGYTQLARSEIAAHRPAPIQVNYLGYPGSMGCDFIDYVIADPIAVPMDQQPFYDEKIVHLPDCYQPNDSQRRIADLTPSRADCGLPERGFVFCCFNNSYKLTPRFFTIWMRLLAAVPGSVLWLFDANAQVKANLQREAMQRGIDPGRLVFAPRTGPTDHLARQRLADLFLDCLPYNAHTTTSDALWAGLPVLTLIGETFAGRVAASLLHAIGLPELVTYSAEDYEALALRLAREPELLAGLRRKLAANRLNAPLFDARRYARHLEAAYLRMWDIWADGKPPQAFSVEALAPDRPEGIARTPYAACPLCGGAGSTPVLTADAGVHPHCRPDLPHEIAWRSCKSCGHTFADGYFAPEDLANVLPRVPLCSDLEEGRRFAAPIIARMVRHVPHGVWLDVAFGSGALLLTTAEWGYEAVGIDADMKAVSALRRLGFEAHCGTLAELSDDGRFAVISLADLLPRQAFPGDMLKAAHRLLRPGGALFLSMPNREPQLFTRLQAENPHWAEFDHYHLFSRSRLYRLLRDHGFEPAEYQISTTHRVGMEVTARKLT